MLAAASGCGDPTVIRVVDGVPMEGRFIRYEAYAAYGRGLEAENDLRPGDALRWYEEAAMFDPRSPEIWTRIGSLHCAASSSSRKKANEAFDRAEEFDPDYQPLFRARARCALIMGDSRGIAYAARAVALDPDNDDDVVRYAMMLDQKGQKTEAVRVLEGHLLRHPHSALAWRWRFNFAMRSGDAAAAERAGRMLEKLDPERFATVGSEVPALAPLARVDSALRQGDLEEARKLARSAHLPPAEIAVRAAALGATKLAREQAEHVLSADPSSVSARVALATASDALEDQQAVSLALQLPTGERLTPLSPLGRLLFAELLLRHADATAARAFIGPLDAATNAVESNADPLFESLRRYLVGRLGEATAAKREGT